jgi:UDP:flavonoid glycosyltransferase YjiC (YdhE family)
MVALPRSADQPGIATRIEYTGIGLQESFSRTNTARLREKIQRVLNDQRFTERTRELQMALWRAGGVYRAADLVDQVIQTGQPVERNGSSRN